MDNRRHHVAQTVSLLYRRLATGGRPNDSNNYLGMHPSRWINRGSGLDAPSTLT
jgi:hypothetical protein